MNYNVSRLTGQVLVSFLTASRNRELVFEGIVEEQNPQLKLVRIQRSGVSDVTSNEVIFDTDEGEFTDAFGKSFDVD